MRAAELGFPECQTGPGSKAETSGRPIGSPSGREPRPWPWTTVTRLFLPQRSAGATRLGQEPTGVVVARSGSRVPRPPGAPHRPRRSRTVAPFAASSPARIAQPRPPRPRPSLGHRRGGTQRRLSLRDWLTMLCGHGDFPGVREHPKRAPRCPTDEDATSPRVPIPRHGPSRAGASIRRRCVRLRAHATNLVKVGRRIQKSGHERKPPKFPALILATNGCQSPPG